MWNKSFSRCSSIFIPLPNLFPTFSVCGENNRFTRVSGLTICHDYSRFYGFATESSRNFKLNTNISTVKLGTDGCFFSASIDAFTFYFCPTVLSFGNNFSFFTFSKCIVSSRISSCSYISVLSIWVIGRFFCFCCSSFFKTFFIKFCRLEGF